MKAKDDQDLVAQHHQREKSLESTIEELKKQVQHLEGILEAKNMEIQKSLKATEKVVSTHEENDRLVSVNSKIMELISSADQQLEGFLAIKVGELTSFEQDVENKLKEVEEKAVFPLLNQLAQMETLLKKSVSVSQQRRAERNDLRQRCSQLVSQSTMRNEEHEKLQMDLSQIQRKNEEYVQQLKMQYEQKVCTGFI